MKNGTIEHQNKSRIEFQKDLLKDIQGEYGSGCNARPHNHAKNREAIEDLINALHGDSELDQKLIKERLGWLAKDYGIDFDHEKPMKIFQSISEEELFDLLGEWYEHHTGKKLPTK